MAFVAAQALDMTTTCVGMRRGYTELNPLMGPHPKTLTVVAVKVIPTVLYVPMALTFRKRHPKVTKYVTLGLTLGSAAAGAWNLTQLR